MAKIILADKKKVGQTLKINGEDIKFDNDGLAEVKDAEGVVEKYKGLFYLEGQEPTQEKEDKRVDKIDNEHINQVLNDKIKDLEVKNSRLEKQVGDWKELTDKQKKEIQSLTKDLEKGVSKSESGISKETIETIYDMAKDKAENLKEICKASEFAEEEWDGLKHKELVIYLAQKSL